MEEAKKKYYRTRGETLVKNLKSRHFDAYYCDTAREAVEKALEIMPEGVSIGWGGAATANEIGLMDALRRGNYRLFDREKAVTAEEKDRVSRDCLNADFFLTGANGLSLDGQMVNIDGTGNRVAAIIFGPKNVLVLAGMNKVCATLEDAVKRARDVAAPMNNQRFGKKNPCLATGTCADCKSPDCICNQIVITRNCRPAGRIQFILVGEDLGF